MRRPPSHRSPTQRSPARGTRGGDTVMVRLRHCDPSQPGISRVRHGKGFRYLMPDGSPAGADDVARAKALVIPPAWKDVWICPWPNGHIQATGYDEAGRHQYLYHEEWRRKRDRLK